PAPSFMGPGEDARPLRAEPRRGILGGVDAAARRHGSPERITAAVSAGGDLPAVDAATTAEHSSGAPGTDPDLTGALCDLAAGRAGADARVMPLVYARLRELADRQLAGERAGHTLQPTALVNEVYLKLVGQRSVHWESRGQFF